ncbi:peptidoglycan editing factor PgeF [Thermosynechococcus sp. GLH187]|uniref:peptidoglycan editing factor PgeF n=1 Tax=unclassified Thermosynechococcus TaxID=2622553 RepID=UPI00197E0014|nr:MULTISPECIES: peptidoglycan editing factor PgeF [unclassified Thermosynechococcus]QSF48488.1 peptidoglycan editing factor PgeF [Thermosynechococcus sp. TA-1]WNC21528.1 peptidoglycan editing factor PgeF [Thermosynechococcus sp. PP22]WNC44384.1 peptidoglycan editing factor PgeF [Thermosynechococcus sp. GLH187]WNC46920.1 peptidoglycan editing factor PgeF [Thermosynechococcus sp. GLH333]WNC49457.1 peptidoglycan editing factor PgeF [Thermosynechococcus sp. GLH87]
MWHWQTTDLGRFLTCDLLQGFQHGFFTRDWQGQDLSTLTAALGTTATPLRTQQVHGDRVALAAEVLARDERLAADALVATGSDQALWVCSADCVPLLIADVGSGRVAAIHAGWRGTAIQISRATLQQMQAFGSDLANLRIAMGPAIRGEVYQVGLNVARALAQTILEGVTETTDRDDLYQRLAALDPEMIFLDPDPERLRVDVARVNRLQLLQLGLRDEQIALSPHCTFRDAECFFSYRREHLKQVQWSGIISRLV